MKILKRINLEILTPCLVAIFPLIYLYANNFKEVRLVATFRSFGIVILLVFLTFKFVNLIVKNKSKSTLIISLLILISLSFGHLSNLLPYFELFKIGSFVFGKNKFLSFIIFVFTTILIFKILKTKKIPKFLIKYIAISSLVIIFLSLLKIGLLLSQSPISVSLDNKRGLLAESDLKNLPDVYYIVLDGHGRADVLRDLYDYQDNKLIAYLKSKDFYVADKSQANYVYTYASLASSLNFNYLENLDDNFVKKGSIDTLKFERLIQDSQVAENFKKLGYSYITFRSGFAPLQKNPFADTHYAYAFGLNNFERSVVNSSILSFLLNIANLDVKEFHRQRVLFTFETLKQISLDDRPTFTFAHILAPHPPFVFNRNGEPVRDNKKYSFADGARFAGTKKEYKTSYLNQLIFIDDQVIETIDKILKNSPTPPIIIIQSDHGPASETINNNRALKNLMGELIDNQNELSVKERSSILNAYYFPKSEINNLYDSITPVNSFRVLFNNYFGQNLELLEDKTFTDR